jgi:hypothetical protein
LLQFFSDFKIKKECINHAVAPKIWQAKIGKIPVVDAAAG